MKRVISSETEQCLLAFVFSPASYMDSSWFEHYKIKTELFSIKGKARVTSLLSSLLLAQEKTPIEVPELTADEEMLVLLCPAKTRRLVIQLGLFFCQYLLKNQVLKNQVAAIKAKLGVQAYEFALKSAPYMIKNRALPLPQTQMGSDLTDEIIAYGVAYLKYYLANHEAWLRQRIFWKLPRKWLLLEEIESIREVHPALFADDSIKALFSRLLQEAKKYE